MTPVVTGAALGHDNLPLLSVDECISFLVNNVKALGGIQKNLQHLGPSKPFCTIDDDNDKASYHALSEKPEIEKYAYQGSFYRGLFTRIARDVIFEQSSPFSRPSLAAIA